MDYERIIKNKHDVTDVILLSFSANLYYGNGYKPEVHVISSTNGSRVATLTITGANVNGFKDIAVGKCVPPIMSAMCIYILGKIYVTSYSHAHY